MQNSGIFCHRIQFVPRIGRKGPLSPPSSSQGIKGNSRGDAGIPQGHFQGHRIPFSSPDLWNSALKQGLAVRILPPTLPVLILSSKLFPGAFWSSKGGNSSALQPRTGDLCRCAQKSSSEENPDLSFCCGAEFLPYGPRNIYDEETKESAQDPRFVQPQLLTLPQLLSNCFYTLRVKSVFYIHRAKSVF